MVEWNDGFPVEQAIGLPVEATEVTSPSLPPLQAAHKSVSTLEQPHPGSTSVTRQDNHLNLN